VRGPVAVGRYVAALASGRAAPHPVGHNPLGGWSVLLMLAVVAFQAVSGLFTSDDISEEGPLVAHVSQATARLMTRAHHLGRYALLSLIVLHVAAVLWHRVFRGDDLVAPMLHGRARIDHRLPLHFAPPWLALLLFASSAAAVWAFLACL
jgi:cytochrome b